MNGKGSVKRAGVIIRETAKACLKELCYSENEINEIIERGDLSEIESLTGIVSILNAVVHALSKDLVEHDRIIPPRYFFSTIVYSDCPETELEALKRKLEGLKASRRVELIMMMLGVVHDTWVKNNGKLFFDSDMDYLKCKFMPLELIGYDTTKQYYPYIESLLDLFGWIVDSRLFLMAYRVTQDRFYLEKELVSDEKLIEYIAGAEYDALSPGIKKILKGNVELARKMVYM